MPASVEKELSGIRPDRDTALTIGVFDGVHLGHKHLLARLVEQARERGLASGVITFKPHPQQIISPETQLPFLTDLAQREALLKQEGVEIVIVLPFSQELAELGAREFAQLLKKHLKLRRLVIGPGFTLGSHREGDASTLIALGKDIGFEVTVVPSVMIKGEMVSSTAIREALRSGDLERVHRLIGRFFNLRGKVVRGEGRGAKLDFPTANLDIDPGQALPVEGVYATRAYIGDRAYQSVTNIGRRPTFNGGKSAVEVYILDYRGDLYGRELKIDIIERVRGEQKFATAAALKRQIALDIERGRAILGPGGGD